MLLLRRPWDRQPPEIVELDRNSAIANSLGIALNVGAGLLYNPAAPGVISAASPVVYAPTEAGKIIRFDRSTPNPINTGFANPSITRHSFFMLVRHQSLNAALNEQYIGNRVSGNNGFCFSTSNAVGSLPNQTFRLQYVHGGVAAYTATGSVADSNALYVGIGFSAIVGSAVRLFVNGQFTESISIGAMNSSSDALRIGRDVNFSQDNGHFETPVLHYAPRTAWTDAEQAEIFRSAYQVYEPQRIWIPVSSTGGVTGALAATNANDASAAAGTTTILGALARTNANDASAAAGATTVLGTLAKTNADDTLAASGAAGSDVSGSVNVTNANDALAGAGTTTVTGALARTNANDTSSAAGTTTVLGTLATTNANDTLAASGAAGAVTGTLATTNGNDTSVGSGSAGQASSATGGWYGPTPKSRKRIKDDRIRFGVIPPDIVEAAAKVAERVVEEAQDRDPIEHFQDRKKRFDAQLKAEMAAMLEPPRWVDGYSLQIQIQIEQFMARRRQNDAVLMMLM